MELLGVPLPDPLTSAGRLARGLGGVAFAALDLVGRRGDRPAVWSTPGRVFLAVRGVRGPGGAGVAHRIERALEARPDVAWARVNAPASRVVVAVRDPAPRTRALVRVVERAEGEPGDEDELHHPVEGMVNTRVRSTALVDAAGMALAVVSRFAPAWATLPVELAGVLSAANAHPATRKHAAERFGHEKADSRLSMATAVAHGLAARGEGTTLDLATRFVQWREARAHERAWRAAEPTLIDGPDSAGAEPVVADRPRPLPDSETDRYARRALAAGAAATLGVMPFTGPRRALGMGIAALPTAASTGGDAFAAGLGRVLARRGVLVMDRTALRRLDLADVLVVDTAALSAGRWQLTDLRPVGDADPASLATTVFELFDADEPTAVRTRDRWRLGPPDQLGVDVPESGEALVLAEGDDVRALVAVGQETATGVDALATAAGRAGLRMVTHTEGDTASAVRRLQAEGRVVMLVSADRRALGAADCGIGVHRADTAPPWGAHLIVGEDLDAIAMIVAAAQTARLVNRDSTRLAMAASGIGAVNALNAPARPAARSLRAVNTGAGLAFADGTWRARRLRDETAAAPAARTGTPWHLMPTGVVLDRLDTREDGLTDAEARRRPTSARGDGGGETTFARAFLAELANPLTPILAGGAALSASVGSPVDAVLVGAIISVSALVGSVQQTRTEQALAKLLARSAVHTTVRRGGTERRVTAAELVVGDVVVLGAGDVVPADCRLLDGAAVEVDESSLTGESLPITKDPAPVVAADLAERTSMVYEGTTLSSGTATAVVVAVGDDTEVGRGMAAARASAPVTGVEARLAELTRKIMPVALGSAAAVTGAGLLHRVPLRETMGAAVNLAVASVPEGLPFLVNAAQLAAARRLAEHNALVRNPRTIEALGRVDVLCFDKTGTLTEGRLTVSQVDDGRSTVSVDALADSHVRVLAAAVRATPHADDPGELSHQTDRAVLEGARRAGVTADAARAGEVAFDPSRGYHATLGTDAVLSVKGAPEVVLPRSAGIDDDTLRRLRDRYETLAASGHRVLAVAERRLSTVDDEVTEDMVDELTLLGFVALSDPVRESAPPAAAKLREAGVQIVMITGDHPATGEAVAGRVNGENDDLTVLTGTEITDLDDDKLADVLPTVDVIARCSPEQKVRIIEAYQRLGKVVAMTGDGANDAPAIRLADVGIALGRRGTPAARAAADLVVTDDRLETIIAALVEGRAMWASVRAALGILLGGNFGEIAFTVLASVLTGRSPLTARQLLLVNLLTDLAPALAIALSQPARQSIEDLLSEGPSASLGEALTRDMTSRAVVTTLGASAAWTVARFTGRQRRASTVALVALVGTQLVQTVSAGGGDRTVLAAGLGSAALLAAIIQTPGVSQFFGCTPLGPVGWSIALGSAGAAGLLGRAAEWLG